MHRWQLHPLGASIPSSSLTADRPWCSKLPRDYGRWAICCFSWPHKPNRRNAARLETNWSNWALAWWSTVESLRRICRKFLELSSLHVKSPLSVKILKYLIYCVFYDRFWVLPEDLVAVLSYLLLFSLRIQNQTDFPINYFRQTQFDCNSGGFQLLIEITVFRRMFGRRRGKPLFLVLWLPGNLLNKTVRIIFSRLLKIMMSFLEFTQPFVLLKIFQSFFLSNVHRQWEFQKKSFQ